MIAYITGTIISVNENFIILDNNGLGYFINMPFTSAFKLQEGMSAKIYTFMAVKEDDVSLYGFTSQSELELFKKLITVNGVGPKAALGILSSLPADELIFAIAAGDHKTISQSKGIGPKTAQKIVVELKDKIDKGNVVIKDNVPKVSDDISTAIAFVSSTGVSRADCLKAVGKIEEPEKYDVDGLIDLIFKNLSV